MHSPRIMLDDATRPAGRGTLLTEDGLHLFTQHWAPDDAPQAVVALVHGYGEHCGRYAHVAAHLTEHGCTVYAYDQRGHGRSEGRRAYIESFDQYLDDLDHFLTYTHERTPDDLPLFLFGHSMGGAVVLRYALERAADVHGLILSSPAIEVDAGIAPFLRKIARFVGRLFPRLPTIRSPEGAISRDPDVVGAAENDPLCYHGRVRARVGAELIRTAQRIQDQMDQLTLPFFVFHGTADKLTSPEASRLLYDSAAAEDKTIELYEGLYHETFNEPEKEQVLQDVSTWLEKHIPSRRSAHFSGERESGEREDRG